MLLRSLSLLNMLSLLLALVRRRESSRVQEKAAADSADFHQTLKRFYGGDYADFCCLFATILKRDTDTARITMPARMYKR